jgi:hypothetical protein
MLERSEDLFRLSRREAAALVFDLDQSPIGGGGRHERNAAKRSGELDGVLEQVCHGRSATVGFETQWTS